jgi:regulator of protease activity HflC (stomatin/prohibitin superfamily)
MIPKLRSILREQGKGVEKSQDCFKESIQRQLQETLQLGLSEFLAPKGLQVETVLIRDVQLPEVIRTAITETKKREQEVLKQQAELERFATEQDQKVKQAESELKAARLEAQKIKELAEAEAYKISVINETLAKSPNYIELKKVEQWNGVLPRYTGGDSVPILDLRAGGK